MWNVKNQASSVFFLLVWEFIENIIWFAFLYFRITTSWEFFFENKKKPMYEHSIMTESIIVAVVAIYL